jgi:hypothetical protein
MNQNTTTATLTQNDLNRLAADEQDFIRYQDLVLLAEKNGLAVEDALFAAEESLDQATAGGEFVW